MDFVRLALVNLYKESPKQARQSKFFSRFFYCFSWGLHNIKYLRQIDIFANPLQTSSLTKLSKHLQATGKQPVHVEGDLIVRARLQFGKHGLSLLFSLKPWKLRHPWRQSGIPGSLWLYIWSLRSTTHSEAISAEFLRLRKTRALHSGLK